MLLICSLHVIRAGADGPSAAAKKGQLAALNALPAAVAVPPAKRPVQPPEPPLITIGEQMEQAAELGVALTQEQLARANPLLGTAGRLKDPQREHPAEWPDG